MLSHPGPGTPTARCGVWRQPPAWTAARFGVGDDNTYVLGCTIRGRAHKGRSVILGASVVTHRQRHPRPPLPPAPVHRNSPLHITRYMYVCVGRGRAPAGGVLGGWGSPGRACNMPSSSSPNRAKCRPQHCQFPPLRRLQIRPGPARLDRADPWPRPGGLGWGFPPPTRPAGGGISAGHAVLTAISVLWRCAVSVAGGLRSVVAGGSAALGLAGHLVGAGGYGWPGIGGGFRGAYTISPAQRAGPAPAS